MPALDVEARQVLDGSKVIPGTIEKVLNLSAMQKGLLIDSLVAEKTVYVQQLACSLRFEVNLPLFQKAWQQIFDRHQVFRIAFRWQDVDEPMQEIHCSVPARIRHVDLRLLPEDEQNKSIEEYLGRDRAQQFDFAQPPLARLALLQLGERHSCLVFSFHHTILDGRARRIVIEEVFRLYDALCSGSPIEFPARPQFEELIAWLNRQDWEKAREYWKGIFADGDYSSVLAALPGSGRAAHTADTSRSWPRITVPSSLTSQLESMARQNGLTLNTLIQGCWAILLHRYSGQKAITIGATRACRRVPMAGASEIVGLLINTVPVRARFGTEPTLLELLQDLRAQSLDVRPYECTPVAKIREFSGVDPESPLFETIAVFEEHGAGYLPGLATCKHVPTEVCRFGEDTYPLSLLAYGRPELYVEIGYDTTRFDPGFVSQMVTHYQTLLEQIPTALNRKVADLLLLNQQELEQIVLEWNRTGSDYQAATVHELFTRQAVENPHSIAVDFAGRQLTYQELNSRSNQLARYLVRRGAGLEKLIGAYLERGVEMVVALLGILKAGGAYVPLDPNYPADRLRFMVNDAGIDVLLTQKAAAAKTNVLIGVTSIDLSGEWDLIARESDEALETGAKPENLAYVIYTSGSTGKPKGVAVEHRQVCNQIFWSGKALSLVPEDRILQKASFSFDASILEIFLPLAYGCCMVVAVPGGEQDPDYLLKLSIERKVTYCDLVPALLEVMLTHPAIDQWTSARIITCGADVLKPETVRKFYTLLSCELWNTYGPTETTVQSTFVPCIAGDPSVPIGRPIANTRLYVLDQNQQPVPVGVTGELYIGGDGVARGYWSRPHITAERFVPDHLSNIPGARLYRTGDAVRYRPDGNLDFAGRIDQQVKIRGFRIELQEIEAVLSEHEAVAQAVVLAVEDKPGNKKLYAFLVARPDCKPSTDTLRSLAESKLPGYMVPALFFLIERLPMTANGKLDRRALEKIGAQADEAQTFEPPQTPLEELLAGIWSQVLRTKQIGRNDNFFHRGGHSLLAMQLALRIKTVFGLDIPLRSIFRFATVASMTAHIQSHSGHIFEQAPSLCRRAGGRAPIGMSQYRLWFLQRLEPQSWTYNVPIRVRLRGPLDKRALEQALEEIVRRHEALRTRFQEDPGGELPVQIIAAPHALEVPVVDCQTSLYNDAVRSVEEIIRKQVCEPFDLQQGPLLRALLVRTDADEHIFVLIIHHIVSDAWSLGLLANELRALYAAFARGEASPLPELAVQYADYVVWQRKWLAGQVLDDQLDYWKQQLGRSTETLALPSARPRLAPVTACGRVRFELDTDTYAKLWELSQREDVTLFMTLLAALTALLHRYTGQQNIVVGTPIAGRTAPEVEKLIGFFVNTLALRCDLSGNPSVRELLGRVRDVALGAYAHQDVPFEKVVEELQPERSLTTTPLFQVMLVMDNATIDWQFKGLVAVAEEIYNESAKCDLTVTLRPGATLEGDFLYRSDVFGQSQAEQMARHFGSLLRQMAVNPQLRLGDLCFLSDLEHKQATMEWNRTRVDYPQACIHHLFEQQAARTPSALAAVCKTQRLTYEELNWKSNQLAHHLRKRGIGPEKLVGVCMERSLDMVVALLAILKAGGAYVPLDPKYPAERLAFILNDTQADVLVTEEQYLGLVAACGLETVLPARARGMIATESSANPAANSCPENMAYVIYTSGSTGRPKGVAIEHRNAALLLFWARDVFPPEDLAGVLAATSICFDLSIFEIFAPLAWGGTVFLASNVLELPEVAVDNDIFLVNSVPSLVKELVHYGNMPASVRTVNLAGEPLSTTLVDELYRHEHIKKVFDLYGPSEDTTYSTFTLRSATAPPTIGRPLANKTTYILDQYHQPVPQGMAGELYIGGDGVARGYFRRPELTAEKFVPDPFSGKAGARLYRTGDEARQLPDGNLEFRGRIDQQVKIRGFRIELGEIESILRAHPAVQQAAVIATEETSGDKRLVAYVVPEAGHSVGAEELRSILRQKLPDFMVPSFFVTLGRLPVNSNGKLDRRALPKPERVQGRDYSAPRSDLEKTLAACWAELLGVERAGVNDNFFDLGGHSMLLVRMQSNLEQALQRPIPILTLFQYPTIASLAAHLVGPVKTANAVTASANRTSIRHGAQRLSKLRTTHSPAKKWNH